MSGPSLSSFIKVGDSYEWSWHKEQFRGKYIVPNPRFQSFQACAFYSFPPGAEMERNKEIALLTLPLDDFDPECLKSDFIKVSGKPLGEDHLDRAETAALLFKYYGVEATSSAWNGTRRLTISDYKRHDTLKFEDAVDMLDSGKSLSGSFLCSDDFDDLGRDEIYSYTEQVDENGVTKQPSRHRVLFIGYGVSDVNDLPYLVFLNSYGDEFGEDGKGRVFFSEISNYYSLSMDVHPSPPTRSMDDFA